ncbi:CAZy families GT61 [Micractinium conductrix]|uniref:CAZy families GT61 n=1 Tax=Micractinium conductrix TaxID=554055 RepID=A0A2P6V6L6_9CHLO|nr:CAZy families GT61 [Micractinium conductrix]|eukprot:PSC69724.1 CAZy families GT61 [Micractinium conductrix]
MAARRAAKLRLHSAVTALLLVALLLLQATRVTAAQLQMELSSHECSKSVPKGAQRSPPFYRPCTFRNLYLWQGMAHYVYRGSNAPDLTKLGLRFEIRPDHEGDDVVLEVVRPVTADAFRALLAADAAAAGQPPVREPAETVPRAYFWKAHKLLPQALAGADSLQDSCETGTGPAYSNYYHHIAEWLPTLSYTLCESFGHCSYANRTSLHLFDINRWDGGRACHERQRYPPFYTETTACLSAHPLRHINGTALRPTLVHVRQAWLGLGPRCRGFTVRCYTPDSGRLPPTPELTSTWRTIAAQCLGVDAQAAAPLVPLQLLVVDREYDSTRHFLNVNTVVRALRRHFSPKHVHVRLAYMEGLSVRQQAALWSSASVVLHGHGAAIGNYFMLPHHAVGVQLAPMMGGYHPDRWTDSLEKDLREVNGLSASTWSDDNPALAHLHTQWLAEAARDKPDLATFLADRSLFGEFMATYQCPKGLNRRMQHACREMLHNLNVVMPVGAALQQAERAVRKAYKQQGREPPGDLLAAEDASVSGDGGDSGPDEGLVALADVEGDVAEQGEQQQPRPGAAAAAGAGAGAAESEAWQQGGQGLAQAAAFQQPSSMHMLLMGAALGAAAACALELVARRRKQRHIQHMHGR